MDYRWQIYLVNLDPTVGSEQGKTRPVLVISDDDINGILPVINILPITSYKQGRSFSLMKFSSIQQNRGWIRIQ
jgi:mRNA interferase MazF